jgi:hypothetical protein
MLLHQAQERGLRGGIQRRGRLVEEPERPMRHEEAGERDAAALAGREIGDGQRRGVRQADGVERVPRRQRRVAEEVAGEGEVLLRGESRFQGVAVADPVQALGERRLAEAFRRDRAGIRPQASREEREQGRLAGSVAARDRKRLAGGQGEGEPREDQTAGAAAGESLDRQIHGSAQPCTPCLGRGMVAGFRTVSFTVSPRSAVPTRACRTRPEPLQAAQSGIVPNL